MVPHAAMGGNLAIESACCLLNSLLSMRDAVPNHELKQIPTTILDEALTKYAENRQQRAEDVVSHAQMVCRDQLCLNENYRQKIVGLNDADWLSRNLIAFSRSEKMRTKAPDTSRVKFYTDRAERVRQLVQRGESITPIGAEAV